MGIYSEYLNRNLTPAQVDSERKAQLRRISVARGNRDVLVYAANMVTTNPIMAQVATSIEYSDLLPISDQINQMSGRDIDVIIETPGGSAEVTEDIVKIIRGKYERVGVIIPGMAKSAGTIFAMAGDEILMSPNSSLGPIDAQVNLNGRWFSAGAFIDRFKKIEDELKATGRLNPMYIPILQATSLGEIQHYENAQSLSTSLVSAWLEQYKFKYWEKHSSSGNDVTPQERKQTANEIASKLCEHGRWLSHPRSIKIPDLEALGLKITDYSKISELNDAITRYYTLLYMRFEMNVFKVYETLNSQIYRMIQVQAATVPNIANADAAVFDFTCPKCQSVSKIQAKLNKAAPQDPTAYPYPVLSNMFKCPKCGSQSDVSQHRRELENATGKKIVQ